MAAFPRCSVLDFSLGTNGTVKCEKEIKDHLLAVQIGVLGASQESVAFFPYLKPAIKTDGGCETPKHPLFIRNQGFTTAIILHCRRPDEARHQPRKKLKDHRTLLIAPRAADLIAVTGNPLESIDALRAVSFVMRDGMVFKKDGAMTPDRFFNGGPVNGWRIR